MGAVATIASFRMYRPKVPCIYSDELYPLSAITRWVTPYELVMQDAIPFHDESTPIHDQLEAREA